MSAGGGAEDDVSDIELNDDFDDFDPLDNEEEDGGDGAGARAPPHRSRSQGVDPDGAGAERVPATTEGGGAEGGDGDGEASDADGDGGAEDGDDGESSDGEASDADGDGGGDDAPNAAMPPPPSTPSRRGRQARAPIQGGGGRRIRVVAPENRLSSNVMTLAEATRAIALRAKQIETNPYDVDTKVDGQHSDAIAIAQKEFFNRASPLILIREMGRTPENERIVEHWCVREMAYPPRSNL